MLFTFTKGSKFHCGVKFASLSYKEILQKKNCIIFGKLPYLGDKKNFFYIEKFHL